MPVSSFYKGYRHIQLHEHSWRRSVLSAAAGDVPTDMRERESGQAGRFSALQGGVDTLCWLLACITFPMIHSLHIIWQTDGRDCGIHSHSLSFWFLLSPHLILSLSLSLSLSSFLSLFCFSFSPFVLSSASLSLHFLFPLLYPLFDSHIVCILDQHFFCTSFQHNLSLTFTLSLWLGTAHLINKARLCRHLIRRQDSWNGAALIG